MPRKIRQLKAELHRAGFREVTRRRSHTKWRHERLPNVRVVLSGNDGDDAGRYQERDVDIALRMLHEIERSEQ